MEFREFSNPESQDYDIKSALKADENNTNTKEPNIYAIDLMDMIGILEDITEEGLQRDYGISVKEYMHPTKETLIKVSKKIGANYNPDIESLKVK